MCCIYTLWIDYIHSKIYGIHYKITYFIKKTGLSVILHGIRTLQIGIIIYNINYKLKQQYRRIYLFTVNFMSKSLFQ